MLRQSVNSQVSTLTNAIPGDATRQLLNIEQTKAYKFSFKPRAIIVGQGQNGQIQTSAKPKTHGFRVKTERLYTAAYSGMQIHAQQRTSNRRCPNAISLWIRFFISFRNT